MNARRKKFIAEYLRDPNATKAALAAGYGKRSAYSVGQRLLTIPEVHDALLKKLEKYEITPERVLAELAKMGYQNADDYCDIVDGKRVMNASKATRDQMAAVSEIIEDTTGGSGDGERVAVLRTRLRFHDKNRALELIGKHLKLYTDVVRHEGLEGLSEKLNKIKKRKGEL